MALAKLKFAMILTMALLFGVLAAIFGLILWYVGADVGAPTGFGLIILFVAVITFLQWYFAPSIIKAIMKMKELPREEFSWVYEFVERTARQTGIPTPKLWVVYDGTPNAFAFGRTKSSSGIALHTGLLQTLNKEEVESVLAHEIGHIKHSDVAIVTLASMVPLLVYYAIIFLASSRSSEDRRGGSMAVVLGAFVAQFLSSLIVMYLSRTREYYADAFSAVVTRKPSNLRTALAKISYRFPALGDKAQNYQSLRAFYIADPIGSSEMSARMEKELNFSQKNIKEAMEAEKKRGALEFFSTHPLTYKRLAALYDVEKDLAAGRLNAVSV
jgi:heat shock protein HtpX